MTTTLPDHDDTTVADEIALDVRDLPEFGLSDAELEALALAHPVTDVVDAAAEADSSLLRRSDLPQSYLPGSMPGPHRPWQGVVAILIIAGLLTITALGFCSTYGQLVFA